MRVEFSLSIERRLSSNIIVGYFRNDRWSILLIPIPRVSIRMLLFYLRFIDFDLFVFFLIFHQAEFTHFGVQMRTLNAHGFSSTADVPTKLAKTFFDIELFCA